MDPSERTINHRENKDIRKRVLHVYNVAGVASSLASIQRKMGLEPKVITKSVHPFSYEEEYYPRWKMLLALRHFTSHDVIHYHGNTWFRRRRFKHLDYRICKRLHKKIVLHFHGQDLRVRSMHQELKEIIDDLRIVFVSTPDLLIFLPSEKSVWLPNPVNIAMWRPKAITENKDKLVVGYYDPPYDDPNYCVDHIEKVIKRLRRKGLDFGTKSVYWKPHSAMPSYYSSIDIYVDRLGMGWYGLSGCEAMASGIPVICYIREDLRQLLPSDEPLLISSKEKFEENLELILNHENLRRQLAERGRKYVLNTHDDVKIAKRLMDIYQEQ